MTPIRRVSVGSFDHLSETERQAADAACGEQIEWGVAIPWAFQALSVPRVCAVMPAAPSTEADFDSALAYWCPLMHLLAYSLAWARPYRGLRWWYDAGKPTDDPRLALIADVWDADGQLDWFAAWLSSHDPHWSPLFDGIALPEHYAATFSPRPAVDAAWLDSVTTAALQSGIPAPVAGGSDGLHLGDHWAGPLSDGGGGSSPSFAARGSSARPCS